MAKWLRGKKIQEKYSGTTNATKQEWSTETGSNCKDKKIYGARMRRCTSSERQSFKQKKKNRPEKKLL